MKDIEQLSEQVSASALTDLTRLVNINSFSQNSDGLIKAGRLIRTIAAERGLILEKQFFKDGPDGAFHLTADMARGGPFIGIIGHFDTVHHPDSPFNTFKDCGGTLTGPGVQDMKSGIIAAIYGICIAKQALGTDTLPIRIVFNADEETGSQDSRPLIEEMMTGARAALIFEGRKISDNALVTSRKGIMMGRMEVTGKASHAGGAPEQGASAIIEAMHKINALNRLNDPEQGIVATTGVIRGGTVPNQIPDFCTSSIDIRFTTLAQEERILQEVGRFMDRIHVPGCTTAYTLATARPPFEKTAGTEALMQQYADSAAALGLSFAQRHGGGGSDGNFTAAMGIPTLDGVGAAGDFPHTDREYIGKASFFNAIKVSALMLKNMLKP